MELQDKLNQLSNGETVVEDQTTTEEAGSSVDLSRGEPDDGSSLFDALKAQAEDVEVEEVDVEGSSDDEEEDKAETEIEFETDDEEEEVDTEDEVETEEAAEPAKAAEAYKPNHKYKALGEEFEFDEDLKAIIKDKETEDKYRKIMSKAKGLDFYEEKHKRLEDSHAELLVNHEEYRKDAVSLAGVVQKFNQHAQSESVDDNYRALKETGFSDKKILNLARHVLQLDKMDPTQRKAYDQRFTEQNQLSEVTNQLESTKQEISQLKVRSAEAEFDGFLSGHSDIVSEFNSREGNDESSFKIDFINFGATLEKRHGKELDYATVLNEFKRIQHLGMKPVAPVAPAPAKIKKPLPTIPNLRGSGQSPISKGFSSMDDLRKYREDNNI